MYNIIIYHCNVHVVITQCNGREILWDHLKDLYKKDGGAHRNAAGLRLVPKLKYEHVFLTSYSKMRVDLAAQVCTVYMYMHGYHFTQYVCAMHIVRPFIVHVGSQHISSQSLISHWWT